jgi:hypothetical protein
MSWLMINQFLLFIIILAGHKHWRRLFVWRSQAPPTSLRERIDSVSRLRTATALVTSHPTRQQALKPVTLTLDLTALRAIVQEA